ncbi:MAG: hypothetical protein KatS3mg103_0430 [Phycisphaerales bacterium]|nr:MAG: hypothetical protein KatS3mg103_0430 [Phycisphaerales bacterium]
MADRPFDTPRRVRPAGPSAARIGGIFAGLGPTGRADALGSAGRRRAMVLFWAWASVSKGPVGAIGCAWW